MDFSAQEGAILNRLYEKTRVAGGATAGYLMRIAVLSGAGDAADAQAALERLTDKGLLQRTEAGDRYLLTEEGAELVSRRGW